MSPLVSFCAYSALIGSITGLFLGILILVKSYKIRTNCYLAYSSFCVFFWCLFYYLWMSTTNNILMAEFYLRTLMLPVLYITPTLFDFLTSFVKRKISPWIRFFNYFFVTGIAFFVYSPSFASNMQPFMGFIWLKAGPLFSVFLLHFAIANGYALWCTWDSYKKSNDKDYKRKINFIFIGLMLTFAGGCINYIPWYGVPIPPVGNILVPSYVVLITYAILKYQLMDIQIIIKNSLVYSVLASLITILYFGMIYLSEHILKTTIGYHSTLISLATAILVAVFFVPVKNFIQSWVEKYIFKATYAQIADQNERLRRQIIASERYKTFSAIAKSVSIAIRDPLTSIKTYNHYLHNKIDDKVFLEKFGQVLTREIQKIQDLTDELSKYSSPDPLSIQRTDIYALINEILDGLKHQLSSQKISLNQYSFDERSSFWLHVDPKQLRQVLSNIILYSVKTMQSGGQLWVGTEKKDDMFFIFIKDTGSPIPKNELEKVFDPFYRYEEESKGLDLAIAFSIIENHGGKILVESDKDSGNEFIIQLPITALGLLEAKK